MAQRLAIGGGRALQASGAAALQSGEFEESVAETDLQICPIEPRSGEARDAGDADLPPRIRDVFRARRYAASVDGAGGRLRKADGDHRAAERDEAQPSSSSGRDRR
jgi:hypothetical protein